MILGINAIGTRHSGAATVLLDFLRGVLVQEEIDRVVVFATRRNDRQFDFPTSDRLAVIDCPPITNHPIARYIWLQTEFANFARQMACESIINLNNQAGRVQVPQLLFIQQSLYFSREAIQAYKTLNWRWRGRITLEAGLMRYFMRASSRRCAAVVVQTETMKQLVSHQLQVPGAKITVIRPVLPELPSATGTSSSFDRLHEPAAINFLYVGNSNPYKRLESIYGAAELARAHQKQWRFFLTIPTPALRTGDNLKFLGMVNKPALAELYSRAHALIMPSLIETIGLPMLEALTLRVPIVAADRPYAHEVCGEAAMYFDPLSSQSLYNCLNKFADDQAAKQKLQERQTIQCTKYPSAEESAARWLKLLQSARK